MAAAHGVSDDSNITINVTNPLNGSIIAMNSVLLNVATNENFTCYYELEYDFCSNLSECEFAFSEMNLTNDTIHSHLINGLEDGNYNLTVRCQDNLNNWSKKKINFKIDTTPPTINITYPIFNSTIKYNLTWINLTTNELSFCYLTDVYNYDLEDTIPPQPFNEYPVGPINVSCFGISLEFFTNERAVCKGDVNEDNNYENMNLSFSMWKYNSTIYHHLYRYYTPSEIGNYTLFVKCQDMAWNTMPTSYSWDFEVKSFPQGKGCSGGGGGGGISIGNTTFEHKFYYENLIDYNAYWYHFKCQDQVSNIADIWTTFSVIMDSDEDGIADRKDNCKYDKNPDQANVDGDNFGDVCDDEGRINNVLRSDFKLDIKSPLNNSVVTQTPSWLTILLNRHAKCAYIQDSGKEKDFVKDEEPQETEEIISTGDAWKVGTSTKILEISEDLTTGTNREAIANITSLGFIDDDEMPGLLASQTASNSKGQTSYNQRLYFEDPNSGYVIYTENDDDVTADFLYFANGRQIARYELEFAKAMESDFGSSSTFGSEKGIFLTDFNDMELIMLGEPFTIVTARRVNSSSSGIILNLMAGSFRDTLLEGDTKKYTINEKDLEVTLNFIDSDEAQFTVNGETTRKLLDGDTDKLSDGTSIGISDILYQDYAGGIHSATFFLGAEKIELRDNLITDAASSHELKVDDETIDEADVIIEGTKDNSTFKINKIIINISADDDFWVPAGGKLSEAISVEGSEPDALFTRNWDIEYLGLSDVATENIEVKSQGSDDYILVFADGKGNDAKVPIANSPGANTLRFGDNDDDLIVQENKSITKDDYFFVVDGTDKVGERPSFALRYRGADKPTDDNPILKFDDLGSGERIERPVSPASSQGAAIGPHGGFLTELATIKLGGASFKVYNTSTSTVDDYDITVDLSGDGTIGSNIVTLNTKGGAAVAVTNDTNLGISISITTPNTDDYGDLAPTALLFNITADSEGEVRLIKQGGNNHNYKTPEDDDNNSYAYTSLGAFVKYSMVPNVSEELTIWYPLEQRVPEVWITSGPLQNMQSITKINSNSNNKWQVGTSTKIFELSESLKQPQENKESIANITTLSFIDDAEIPGLLRTVELKYVNGEASYDQRLYFEDINSGVVIHEKINSSPNTYLYYKNGSQIARYELEFTDKFNSTIYNDKGLNDTNGINLNDFEKTNIEILGINYTISSAKKLSKNVNGIELKFENNDSSLVLRDDNLENTDGSHSLEVNDQIIAGTMVTIEGTESNNILKLDRISINISAEEDAYVAPGQRLSEKLKNKESLITDNWDISFTGFSNAPLEDVKIIPNGTSQYLLQFVDGNERNSTFPLAYADGQLKFGSSDNNLVNKENKTIKKGDNFILVDESQEDGERKSYVLEYIESSNSSSNSGLIKFKFAGSYHFYDKLEFLTVQIPSGNYGDSSISGLTMLGVIEIGNRQFGIYNVSSAESNDFDILVDLNGDGSIQNNMVSINTLYGAKVELYEGSLKVNISTPNRNHFDDLQPTPAQFEIFDDSGKINMRIPSEDLHKYVSTDSESSAYTSHGTFVNFSNITNNPPVLMIKYPKQQRVPLVYVESGSEQKVKLENLAEGTHDTKVNCTDIFGNEFVQSTSFSFSASLGTEEVSSQPSSSGGGGSSGGGRGGGSGGGGAFVCNVEWQCSGWSSCVEGTQARTCELASVGQYVSSTYCPDEDSKPETEQDCAVEIKEVAQSEDNENNNIEIINDTEPITSAVIEGNQDVNQATGPFSGIADLFRNIFGGTNQITGQVVVRAPGKENPIIGIVTLTFLVSLIISVYFRFYKK